MNHPLRKTPTDEGIQFLGGELFDHADLFFDRKSIGAPRLPDGREADADKGYQGLAAQVELVSVFEPATGSTLVMPRLRVKTPFKKPKGRELTDEQKAFNRVLGAIRIRVEHCLGWAILATRFRCDHTIYTSIMRTICGFVNVQTQRWQVAEANCA